MEELHDAQPQNGDHDADIPCAYELQMEERIRKNNERMQELGVGIQIA